jgi:serine/threonine protein kinase
MPAVTLNSFVEALSHCTVLDAEQRLQLPELHQRCADSRQLARELLRRGWLTAYQINLIAQGRARELHLGPYLLLERIGEGAMGQVFKARQSSLHRLVALKVVRPECLANQRVIRRFLREIEAASQLVHPNVVHAYDADQIGGAYYIAMEYVEGIDLAQLVRQSGPLPVWLACDLMRQAALGLQHAFEHGLIHRDIKPANLLVSGISNPKKRAGPNGAQAPTEPIITTPVLKITDFGLARWTDDDPDRPNAHLTQVGSVLGTPEFMSPEQTRNSSTCDIRADLYSLGCTAVFS